MYGNTVTAHRLIRPPPQPPLPPPAFAPPTPAGHAASASTTPATSPARSRRVPQPGHAPARRPRTHPSRQHDAAQAPRRKQAPPRHRRSEPSRPVACPARALSGSDWAGSDLTRRRTLAQASRRAVPLIAAASLPPARERTRPSLVAPPPAPPRRPRPPTASPAHRATAPPRHRATDDEPPDRGVPSREVNGRSTGVDGGRRSGGSAMPGGRSGARAGGVDGVLRQTGQEIGRRRSPGSGLEFGHAAIGDHRHRRPATGGGRAGRAGWVVGSARRSAGGGTCGGDRAVGGRPGWRQAIGWSVADGRVAGRGWRVADGGSRMADGGWRVGPARHGWRDRQARGRSGAAARRGPWWREAATAGVPSRGHGSGWGGVGRGGAECCARPRVTPTAPGDGANRTRVRSGSRIGPSPAPGCDARVPPRRPTEPHRTRARRPLRRPERPQNRPIHRQPPRITLTWSQVPVGRGSRAGLGVPAPHPPPETQVNDRLRVVHSPRKVPRRGRSGPPSPCAAPGYNSAHTRGLTRGQLGLPVDRTDHPHSSPRGRRLVPG